MNFGKQLKLIRKQKGYTLEMLAAEYNVRYGRRLTKSTLSRYENNRQVPSAETIQRLAQLLGVSAEILLSVPKEHTDIAEIMEETRQKLLTAPGLMLDGQPMTQEDIEKILFAMKIGMETVKEENQKYTPRKYRKE